MGSDRTGKWNSQCSPFQLKLKKYRNTFSKGAAQNVLLLFMYAVCGISDKERIEYEICCKL